MLIPKFKVVPKLRKNANFGTTFLFFSLGLRYSLYGKFTKSLALCNDVIDRQWTLFHGFLILETG